MRRASAAYRIPFTSVDLPDPDTPVTEISCPNGNDTVTSWRLFSRAPTTVTDRPVSGRLAAGSGIDRRPARYAPVRDSLLASSSLTGPETITSPPCSLSLIHI